VACPGAGGALLGVLCPSGTSAAPGASERAGGVAGRGAGLVGRGAHGRLRAMQDELGRGLEAVGSVEGGECWIAEEANCKNAHKMRRPTPESALWGA